MSRHLRRLLRFFLLMALGGAGLVLAEDLRRVARPRWDCWRGRVGDWVRVFLELLG